MAIVSAFSFEEVSRTLAHGGQLFTAATYATISTTGETYDILIATGPEEIEIKGAYEAYTSGATVDLYAEPTVSAAGTAVTSSCNSQVVGRVPRTVITHTPTVTDVGTKLLGFNLNAANKVRSTVSSESVRCLKSNTLYLVRFTATGNGAEVQAFLEWTEV